MKERCFDRSCADVLAPHGYLVVIKTNKNAAMSRTIFGPVFNLVEDELESKQTDLKNERAAFDLMIPIESEAKGLRVEGERFFGFFHKEYASSKEVIHRPSLMYGGRPDKFPGACVHGREEPAVLE